jgi:hypothetical protein
MVSMAEHPAPFHHFAAETGKDRRGEQLPPK